MSGSINSSDTLSALPAPTASKGQGVKKAPKNASAANMGAKIEADTYVSTGGGRPVLETHEEPTPKELSGESLITLEDVYALVEAYNRLPDELGEDFQSIRVEMYKPVRLNGQGRQISLYEIGVAHSPDNRQMGMLSIDRAQLTEALKNRASDVDALFLQEEDGLLKRLSALMQDTENAEPFLRVCDKIWRFL